MNSNFLEDKSPLVQGVDGSAVFWRKVLHEVVQGIVKHPDPCTGGEGGKPWDDETFSGIKQMVLSRSEAICFVARMSYVFSSWLVNDVVHSFEHMMSYFSNINFVFERLRYLCSSLSCAPAN